MHSSTLFGIAQATVITAVAAARLRKFQSVALTNRLSEAIKYSMREVFLYSA